MCIRRETREKARRSLTFPPVSKPHTHITYMLRQCTSIVYVCFIRWVFLYAIFRYFLYSVRFGIWSPFQQCFSYIVAISFIGAGNQVPGIKHRPAASHWHTLSHNVVHLGMTGIRPHSINGDRHRYIQNINMNRYVYI
jgi:hypothetical protein